ncbi:hypothetical protein MHH33_16355 [Paenisporosarcina sp. FSL H8-0542]|uniref:hypothetical protein n=1 Tax=unclassified Paenisporosarcina TaxID=2642018 RepID=UPI00034E9BE9|nr:hypothetical protein [Paenisporosarcina sp. HGH0030]EPD51482.1 hypothetical protein HMPREF1210_02080 [Paenisporosarcina sp. HGH0030]
MFENQPDINTNEITPTVMYQSKMDRKPLNICLACGQEFDSFKESIQCCADLD